MDGDGSPDFMEDAGNNGGDGNGDGILDSLQGHVAGAVNSIIGGGKYTTLEVTDSCIVSSFTIMSESNINPDL